jgi:hypothetical protein
MQYHDKNLKKTVPYSPYKMNEESDRYRCCKNCSKEFMTPHRHRIFCDDECSNEYHNALKRYNRDMKKLQDEIESQQQIDVAEEIIEKANKVTIEETIDETYETILKSNISILESLNVAENGTKYYFEVLESYGFDFTYYNGRGQLFNIDPKLNCHFTQVGTFRLCRVEYSKILITNLINKVL